MLMRKLPGDKRNIAMGMGSDGSVGHRIECERDGIRGRVDYFWIRRANNALNATWVSAMLQVYDC